MTKTKQELEHELRIYKAMYKKASEEKIEYLILLSDIAYGYMNVARLDLERIMTKDYDINTWNGGKVIRKLEEKIRGV